ncbi:hypothetical protein VN97_g9424 [Penicillium thymicola]|uniref:Uncharacterized protein n=1 Tax=Penicillium thymicola TaxID=293382 RepID=A0AAI9TAX2_PENTH|nr:hypothetical protein VN97_g9424 [Penicillium thymicola]
MTQIMLPGGSKTSRQLRHCSVCYGLWYAIQDLTEGYADLANFPDPGVSLSTIRPWSKIDEEDGFYKIGHIRVPSPFTWGWHPLSLDEFCVRDREYQITPYPHLQMAIFSFDCPDDSCILLTFSGSPSIAALLILHFWRSSSTRDPSLLFRRKA